MELNANSFDWNNIAAGSDPFANTNDRNSRDERFYVLTKDKDTGAGAAIIRFLPDGDVKADGSMGTIQKINKINTTIIKNGKKRFVNEISPTSAGLPCPFQDKWSELWNAGDKDNARKFSRNERFITNIKIIKDPANPKNEGKIFLFDMSKTLANKINGILQPSETDIALGAKPMELFNPFKGHNFKLVSIKGANGFIEYTNSSAVGESTAIYDSVDEGISDIKENAYKLSEFTNPENMVPYEKLQEKLKWVMWEDTPAVQGVSQQTQQTPQTPQTPEVSVDTQSPSAALGKEASNEQNSASSQEPTQEIVREPVQSPSQEQTPVSGGKQDDLDKLLAGLKV